MPSQNPVAMVSGASRGIGAAIAARLIDAGWSVSLGVRNIAAEDLPKGENVLVSHFDALDPDSEKRWVEETMARFGRLDGLVHNAGMHMKKTALEATDAEFDMIFNVNVKSPMRLTQLAWPHLEQAPSGRIVIIASLSGKRIKSPGSGLYGMSKFAVMALGHALRQCGRENGVRSTLICPGFVATDMGLSGSDRDPTELTQPADIARIVQTVLELPKTASIAEIPVNFGVEECF